MIINSLTKACTVLEYKYDSYGNIVNWEDIKTNTLANINPYTFRGYIWDKETNLYYLNSRYYNPETGRFLNGDGMIQSSSSVLGNNLFTYTENNPVMNVDPTGYCYELVDEVGDQDPRSCRFYVGIGYIIPELIESYIARIYKNHQYINSQGDNNLQHLMIGDKTAKQAGCGPIAMYNADVMLGGARDVEYYFSYLDNSVGRNFNNGAWGTNPIMIATYFSARGKSVNITLPQFTLNPFATFDSFKSNAANIILYWDVHNNVHYMAFKFNYTTGFFDFYNPTRTYSSVNIFLKENEIKMFLIIEIN